VQDTVKPIITIIGDKIVNYIINTRHGYIDKGAIAVDNVDGDITNKIITSNNVNINMVGTYTVEYNVSDNVGNKAETMTRTVHVIRPLIEPVINSKKWVGGNNDASNVILNRKRRAMINNSTSSGVQIQTTISAQQRALHRVRSGGSSVPSKVTNRSLI